MGEVHDLNVKLSFLSKTAVDHLPFSTVISISKIF